jgi:hypothetical protein
LQGLEPVTLRSEWESSLERDGVVRIESALSPDLSDAIRYYVEDQKILAWFSGMEGAEAAAGRVFYGQRHRENNCELQLSVLRGGFAGDNAKNVSDTERHILADVLEEVIGGSGSLSSLLEDLVTLDGELFELTALVTDPGNHNDADQTAIQSVLPAQGRNINPAPLYSIILALQDIDINMGPQTFFLNTHTSESPQNSECRISTMKKGDAIVYDARILCSYGTNDAQTGSTSTTLNMSFRNPETQVDLGYVGSLRPGYRGAMNLGDLKGSLAAYVNGDGDAFQKYGDGIRKPYHNVDAQ